MWETPIEAQISGVDGHALKYSNCMSSLALTKGVHCPLGLGFNAYIPWMPSKQDFSRIIKTCNMLPK